MSQNAKDTDSHIGRRLKLRDLQILASVAQHGSMAKAAAQLSTTQPTVSQAIADLEDAVGVRLFDRSTQGVVPTVFGDILLRRSAEAFDALKQGMRDIEFHASSGAGDVWVGCMEALLHGLLPAVIQRLAQQHPKIIVHATEVNPSENVHVLSERKLDLLIGRSTRAQGDDELHSETLFEDAFTVVTGENNPWARRRKVALADLMDEGWLYGEASNATQARISEIILAKTGRLPRVAMYTTSMNLRLALLASGDYISCIPGSVYRYGAAGRPIKALPTDMALKLPVAILTLKNRTLSPAVKLFIETAREVAKAMATDT
jgi:DNA-binding transcriptional LysR family regulator